MRSAEGMERGWEELAEDHFLDKTGTHVRIHTAASACLFWFWFTLALPLVSVIDQFVRSIVKSR